MSFRSIVAVVASVCVVAPLASAQTALERVELLAELPEQGHLWATAHAPIFE